MHTRLKAYNPPNTQTTIPIYQNVIDSLANCIPTAACYKRARLEHRPFSELVDSAGELLHTP